MILFTADWHIKLGQKNVPKEWAVNRYREFFSQIFSLEPGVSLHIVGGDLFDRLPTMEELELYFEFIRGINVDTLIFDGNHEATRKNQTFFSHLKNVTHSINNKVWIIDEPTTEMRFSILPYCYLHQKSYIENLPADKPLFTHVRGEIPPHVKAEINLDKLDKFPIVFAGDLHSHSNTQRNIVYPGSPMTTSFHRSEVKTGYLLIDDTDWSWTWKEFKLPQLLRKTVSSEEDMKQSSYHHTIYELEGDLAALSTVKNSELLDKKVVKRSSETSLILEKEMSVQEELIEYLTYILQLEANTVKNIIGVFNDYT